MSFSSKAKAKYQIRAGELIHVDFGKKPTKAPPAKPGKKDFSVDENEVKKVSLDDIAKYLEGWRDPESYTDFNLALDRGFVEYAAWLIDSAGAINPEQSNDPVTEQAIVNLLDKYTDSQRRKDIDEMLKNTEVWIDPKTNEHAFIPQGDVDYFVRQEDLRKMGYEFDHGYDKNGKKYKQSVLKD
jgi:hypothetical protein